MKAIIKQPQKESKYIKFHVPYHAIEWRNEVKSIRGIWWNVTQKLWSVPNTDENMARLKEIFGQGYQLEDIDCVKSIPVKEINEQSLKLLESFQAKIILKGYSVNTLKNYKNNIINFLSYFEEQDLESLTKADIESYVYKLKVKYKISDTKQNGIINSIKFLYEQVFEKQRTYYNIQRPKKSQSLPNVLSEQEVLRLINSPKNIKHKAILYTIYSAGLRISEVINLRIEDIRSDEKMIFVKCSKGKKDRFTLLSVNLLVMLRRYFAKERPSYWLFEGVEGGRYSTSSIQKIFRKAVKDARINPWATPHTLRHSFATHLLQEGVNLRYLQTLLGHNSTKTTEIYTHVLKADQALIMSPLDRILEKKRLT